MTIEEKIELLEELMDVEPGTLTVETVLDDIEEWDSLSKLSLIAEAKKGFGLALQAETLNAFTTVKDICNFLG